MRPSRKKQPPQVEKRNDVKPLERFTIQKQIEESLQKAKQAEELKKKLTTPLSHITYDGQIQLVYEALKKIKKHFLIILRNYKDIQEITGDIEALYELVGDLESDVEDLEIAVGALETWRGQIKIEYSSSAGGERVFENVGGTYNKFIYNDDVNFYLAHAGPAYFRIVCKAGPSGSSVHIPVHIGGDDGSAWLQILQTGSVAANFTSTTYNLEDLGDYVYSLPSITVDDALSTTSTNPVQNAVITSHIQALEEWRTDIHVEKSGSELILGNDTTTQSFVFNLNPTTQIQLATLSGDGRPWLLAYKPGDPSPFSPLLIGGDPFQVGLIVTKTLTSALNFASVTYNLEDLGDYVYTIPIITVDSSLSDVSTNPVQNAVIKAAIDAIPIITVDSTLNLASANPVRNSEVSAYLIGGTETIKCNALITSAVYTEGAELAIGIPPIPSVQNVRLGQTGRSFYIDSSITYAQALETANNITCLGAINCTLDITGRNGYFDKLETATPGGGLYIGTIDGSTVILGKVGEEFHVISSETLFNGLIDRYTTTNETLQIGPTRAGNIEIGRGGWTTYINSSSLRMNSGTSSMYTNFLNCLDLTTFGTLSISSTGQNKVVIGNSSGVSTGSRTYLAGLYTVMDCPLIFNAQPLKMGTSDETYIQTGTGFFQLQFTKVGSDSMEIYYNPSNYQIQFKKGSDVKSYVDLTNNRGELTRTINHASITDDDNSTTMIGRCVQLTGDVYDFSTDDPETDPISNTDQCVPGVELFDGTSPNLFVGVITRQFYGLSDLSSKMAFAVSIPINPVNPYLAFATHGDFLVLIARSITVSVGDILIPNSSGYARLPVDTAELTTYTLAQAVIGKVTATSPSLSTELQALEDATYKFVAVFKI